MATTLGWRTSRMLARTSARNSRSHRVRTRLWTVLNAPGLLRGSTGGADSAMCPCRAGARRVRVMAALAIAGIVLGCCVLVGAWYLYRGSRQ